MGLLHKYMNALIRRAFDATPSPEIGGRLTLGYMPNYLNSQSNAMIY